MLSYAARPARIDLQRAAPSTANRDLHIAGAFGESHGNADRVLVKCAFYLYLAYIGAATLTAALLQLLLDSEARWLSTLVLTLCGFVLAVTSWRCARSVLALAERSFDKELP
jgi:O-antigen ligase